MRQKRMRGLRRRVWQPVIHRKSSNTQEIKLRDPSVIHKKSSNTQEIKLRDPYVRLFCWVANRIGEEGMIGFVTNRSYLGACGANGFRKVVWQASLINLYY